MVAKITPSGLIVFLLRIGAVHGLEDRVGKLRPADGAQPRPIRPDVMSDRMSPFLRPVMMTSNHSGNRTSWCAQLSTIMCCASISGYSGAMASNVRLSVPSVIFMMFDLVAQWTFLRPSARASSKPRRTIFSQPLREISLSASATPGVCMY